MEIFYLLLFLRQTDGNTTEMKYAHTHLIQQIHFRYRNLCSAQNFSKKNHISISLQGRINYKVFDSAL